MFEGPPWFELADWQITVPLIFYVIQEKRWVSFLANYLSASVCGRHFLLSHLLPSRSGSLDLSTYWEIRSWLHYLNFAFDLQIRHYVCY